MKWVRHFGLHLILAVQRVRDLKAAESKVAYADGEFGDIEAMVILPSETLETWNSIDSPPVRLRLK